MKRRCGENKLVQGSPRGMFSGVGMTKASRLTVVVLVLTAGCWAQNLLTVQVKGKQKWPAEEADKLYLSACSAVQREFGGSRSIRPQITLVLGANKDQAVLSSREIRLIKWNPYLFAQGVVTFAFEDRMPPADRLAVARRAVNWAGSTIEIKAISK
jgi:hypothetical protein